MNVQRSGILLPAILLLASTTAGLAADQSSSKVTNGWDDRTKQPAQESVDLNAYNAIREEGLEHSHIMDYGGGLIDGIGPRLTGSPNMAKANTWTRDQLTKMGCVHAHLEDWGEFGMGWHQLNTWARMTEPDQAIFVAQAVPWSPASKGPVTAPALSVVVEKEEDLAKYRGKLSGKIVLLGALRPVPVTEKPFFERYSDQQLRELETLDTENPEENQARIERSRKRARLAGAVLSLFAEEKVAGVIVPSRDGKSGGGTGIIFDDNGADYFPTPYKKEKALPFPMIVAQIESYGRAYRLLAQHVPVSIQMDVETEFTSDHEHGFNTIAEIPGSDPALKEEVVMVGGHLDSWIAGSGATDNGAGTIAALEVMRILNSLKIKPRRTIRIALWSGEEQGLLGSKAYADQHFGSFPLSTAPDQLEIPAFLRNPAGPLTLKPEQKLISAYFNVDNGSGRIRGIFTQGNAAMDPIFKQWMEPLRDLGVSTLSNSDTGGTDHLSFTGVGIPGFQFIQDPMDYETRTHHSDMDTYEHLQADDLKQIATVEAIFVYNAAMRDEMLPRKPLPHPERQATPLPDLYPTAASPQSH